MEIDKVGNYQKTEDYYNKYGSWYDQERSKGYYEFINNQEIEIVREYGENKNVLEIGCGTGIILNEVNKFTLSARGIDLSPGMLEKAKEKNLNVQMANATKIPFPDNSFDLVYSFKVLAHIPEVNKVIEEAARVVKNDGVLILEFYNPYSLKKLTNWVYNLVKRRGVYIRYDGLGKIKSYLPNKWKVTEYYGIKVLAIGKKLSLVPIFKKLEKKLMQSWLGRFGGYFVVVIKKDEQ
ncbi:MAG: hypothetical protein COT24_01160 [Candidatus Kerfeldbacteria bacterium CG08_land_8_20_14_0_20_40_16]|uniref:Methyltransferase type 11 domain-containing protein n=1 Tax=Candidatus Kerfeldbacteria bacterium CG08_land_8_20_14_0_20_40_16 TaxID=2014244 RepID=A0A2H0YWL2_9BACT|nr:MAG: hypothetical protein COT24_01160 [Candidatus Kerfeldbacteria bacterium CG08_land_8_20_14_0_20_40_16]